MNFCRFTSKIPRNPIGCGFEVHIIFTEHKHKQESNNIITS